MLVVDAGVLVVVLADDGPDGRQVRARLRGEQLVAPELVDLEVASALRGLVRGKKLDAGRAKSFLEDLQTMPLRRVGHQGLIPRCWELRNNLTPYDAAYVALAERLQTRLLTGDARLGLAPGPRCRIEVFVQS